MLKEITQMPKKNSGSIQDTYINNCKTGQTTTITKHFNKLTGKVCSLFSQTKALERKNPIVRFIEQYFEDGKLKASLSSKRSLY